MAALHETFTRSDRRQLDNEDEAKDKKEQGEEIDARI